MGRCNNDLLMRKIGVEKLTPTTEVTFTVIRDLDNCRRINARNYIDISDTTNYPKYRKNLRPENRFECDGSICANSGTLMLTGFPKNTEVSYFADFDAIEFAAGVVTFYVYAPEASEDTTVTFTIASDSEFADADVYTATFKQPLDDGFFPVVINLEEDPASVIGEGWTANQQGAYIKIKTDIENQPWGLSSISIFDSIDDFETLETVTVGCLSEVGGSLDVETIEATCLHSGYNTDVTGFDYTITGKSVTPNYKKLSPLMGKGERSKGFSIATIKKTVIKAEDSEVGYVCLPDAFQDECGYFAVDIADTCSISLKQLSLWDTSMEPDEEHFLVNVHKESGNTSLIFNRDYIGKEVIIKYPQMEEVEELVARADNLEGVHTRMAVPVEYTDGTKEIHVFENVYVTSFPFTINTEETEFSFTINIQRDKEGNFFRILRIVTEN